ncbi:MAG: hypothetical protein EZS28_016836 [Streblomastix strix]|uniref:Uncharacterized protein n=1 Tax=Streblomastix strix TaxID=222440 RepID=A0A5J4VYC3_9EUKA|nr:MAG: hypothetical protein EZS28_016836 [Streblomastix strix]
MSLIKLLSIVVFIFNLIGGNLSISYSLKLQQPLGIVVSHQVEAAFEGMKGAIRRQRHFGGIDPNDLIEYYREFDEHICGVHDPLQGVHRDVTMSDQYLGINARANELANDTGSNTIPQPSLCTTTPPKGVHQEHRS